MVLKNYKRVEINFLKNNDALLQRAGEAPKLQFLTSKGELSPYSIIEASQTLSISTLIPTVIQTAHVWNSHLQFWCKE